MIERLLRKYAPVRLDVDVAHLAEGDRRALRLLAESAAWIDRIYWKQRSEGGLRLRERLGRSQKPMARHLQRLLEINFGPWDTLNDDRPFWGHRKRPLGGDLYPPDLGRDELKLYVTRHPEQQQSILSHTTLVRRQGDRLIAIPYQRAYADELSHVAAGLRAAADAATHAAFRAFLRARAKDLVSGELRESDTLWIGAAESPIDIAIGPYEVYDDALMGLKTSYEATVMVRHPLTERIRRFETVVPELERTLPGVVAPASSKRRIALGVYDVVVAAGMSAMGSKTVAATLPNDEHVRTDIGSRLLLYRNVITAKFQAIVRPMAEQVLSANQRGLVSEDAFVFHTALHELAHAVSACFVQNNGSAADGTINEALRERYATIEECRADLMGLVFLDLLARRGELPAGMEAEAAVTFIVSSMRTLRFGAGDDYSRGAAIILSHLLKRKSVVPGPDGGLVVDVGGVYAGGAELARTIQNVASRGDYEAAGQLIAELGGVPPAIQRALPRVTDIPVDIDFVFDDESL